ncbi:MAG: hypothetical protein PHI70_07345 [Proteiniphilum sp.]|nr:hypothetical protein [Proteiniphilum sp.]MDD4416581.1 hypothetical protein [Proteiniphilum sp.]
MILHKSLRYVFMLLSLILISNVLKAENQISPVDTSLKISVFDLDATPPVGTALAYGVMNNNWDLGLRARGIVIMGSGKPVVLCAIDWIGIANESHVAFRGVLAEAAGTTPDRVALHTLHQHDAPRSDFSAEKLLIEAALDPGGYRSEYDRKLMNKLAEAVKESLKNSFTVSHIGLGKSEVSQVASSRRIFGSDSLVKASRFSACGNRKLREEPEGLIDPMVSLISFWDNEKALAVLSFYATHPQSYYRTGIANPDFPGIARFLRQLEVPDALHIHFNGAGGNIAAGKYNDGSKINRWILAQRLADGMKRAWEATEKEAVSATSVEWLVQPVRLHPSDKSLEEIKRWENSKDKEILPSIVPEVAYIQRYRNGGEIDITCLKIGKARIIGLPGECFVEFQLFAKNIRPDLFVTVAAYGDYGPGYIAPREAYKQGGYEVEVSGVSPGAGDVLMQAMKNLLNHK